MDAQTLQNQILYRVAAAMPAGPLYDAETTALMQAIQIQIPTIWAMYSDKAAIPLLQYQYALWEAANTILGQLRLKRDGVLGQALRVTNSQLVKNIKDIVEMAYAEIEKIQQRGRANLPVCVGGIVQREPVMGRVPVTSLTTTGGVTVAHTKYEPGFTPDPNSPVYTGSDPRVRPPITMP